MPVRKANATWNGSLIHGDGDGDVALGSGVWRGTFATPDVDESTDPEELLAAAHASCYAMSVTYLLEESGYTPEYVSAESVVTLEQREGGFTIPSIDMVVSGQVRTATDEEVKAILTEAEDACPVSQALAGTEIVVSVDMGDR